MTVKKKGLFKKIGAGLLVAAAMAPLALGLTSIKSVSAAETDFTISLHKMVKNSDDAQTIESDGAEKTDIPGYEVYDKKTDGNVEFSIFDIESTFEAWKDEQPSGQYADDGEAFNAFQQELISKFSKDAEGNDLTVDEILVAQRTYLTSNGLTAVHTIDTKSEGWTGNTFNFNKEGISNEGKYLILETDADSSQATSISAPLIFGLLLKDHETSSKIHLYAKNTVPKTDPGLEKQMQDPEDITKYITKAGVEFTLTGPNGSVTKTTGEDGKIEIQKLSNGDYSLEETKTLDGWKLLEGKFLFNVNNGTLTKREGSADWAILTEPTDGRWVFKIDNFLTTGDKDFIKVDSEDEELVLEGAEFVVTNNNTDTRKYAQLDGNNKFVKWVTNLDNASEITSDDDGKLSVSGLPYNGEGTRYYLQETKAPAGYGLKKELIPFTINSGSSATSDQEIENTKIGLPTTGGMGIWLFVLVGAVMMGGAGFYYYKSRKNKLV